MSIIVFSVSLHNAGPMQCDACGDRGYNYLGCRQCDFDICGDCVCQQTSDENPFDSQHDPLAALLGLSRPTSRATSASSFFSGGDRGRPADLFFDPRTRTITAGPRRTSVSGLSENSASPISITSEADFLALLKSERGNRATVVDITADWCPPSRVMKPVLQQLAGKHENVLFLVIETDTNTWIRRHRSLQSEAIPHFVFFSGGEKVAEVSGADPEKVAKEVALLDIRAHRARRDKRVSTRTNPRVDPLLSRSQFEGQSFELQGLQSRADLNGSACIGMAIKDGASKPYVVCICEAGASTMKHIAVSRSNINSYPTADAVYKVAFALYASEGCDNGSPCHSNLVKIAATLLEEAANDGNTNAQKAIGLCYDKGHGVLCNPTKAFKWYMLAAKSGHGQAMCNVGIYLLSCPETVPTDLEAAYSWFSKAVDAGNDSACAQLAECYENGVGVQTDLERAISLYELAMQRGYSRSSGIPMIIRDLRSRVLIESTLANQTLQSERAARVNELTEEPQSARSCTWTPPSPRRAEVEEEDSEQSDSGQPEEPVAAVKWQNLDNCSVCYLAFTFFKRRHHCRKCGNSVCNGCSSKMTLALEKPELVCNICYGSVSRYDQKIFFGQNQRGGQRRGGLGF